MFVPLPGSPSDHQMRNAQTLEQAGAALVVRDAECDPNRLDGIVSELLVDARPARPDGQGRGQARRGPTPPARVADLVEEYAR